MQLRVKTWVSWGLIGITALMPFHAFLVIWVGHIAGHQALWQSWKEAVLVVLLALAAAGTAFSSKLRQRLNQPVVLLIGGFILITLIITAWQRPPGRAAVFGIKTDLEFLAAFILAVIAGSRSLRNLLAKIIIGGGLAVSALAALQATILPKNFFQSFGYSAANIAPVQYIDPAVKSLRVFSTLGGPNQLGCYLILPICLLVMLAVGRRRWWAPLGLAVMLFALWHTYSRSAWLGAAIGIWLTLFLTFRRRALFLTASLAVLFVAAAILQLSFAPGSKLQYYVFHSSLSTHDSRGSDFQHQRAIDQGFDLIKSNPLGYGLGTAGPASFYSKHPVIPENFYLQLAIESGLLGAALFIAICLALGIELWRLRAAASLAAPAVGALAGISTVNLFLHGWADSSTALIFWIFAGSILGAALNHQDHVKTD